MPINEEMSSSPDAAPTTPAAPAVAGWKRFVGNQLFRTQYGLTAIGERLGWQWLIYNPLATFGFRRAALRNAPLVTAALREVFPDCRRVIDVGCASGLYVKQMNDSGLSAVGVEFSARLRKKAKAAGQDVYPFDVSVPTPPPPSAPFDLAMSLEVAEHVPAALADAFVAYFRGLSDWIVFTAAQPGQGGTNHINEQPRAYWIEKFAAQGFALDAGKTATVRDALVRGHAHWYLPANVSVFRGVRADGPDRK